jgi:ABC-type ATPase with predicted acetyltransferase domain
MGATEIDDIRFTDSRIEVILNDAGARDGSLTFHSTRPLSAGKSENCAIASVEAAGEDLWMVHLKDRHIGAAQSVQIAISPEDAKP